MERERKSGILLHISSLPSDYGIGDLGQAAYQFVDQLAEMNCAVWQILPLGPNGPGNSPYQAYSAYAGDLLFISPDELCRWGLVNDDDLNQRPAFSSIKVDFQKVTLWKTELLKIAFDRFKALNDEGFQNEFSHFMEEHGWWLNDYAMFCACRKRFDELPWNEWPSEIAKREPYELEMLSLKLVEELAFEKFTQFMFFRQWFRLKNYANNKRIQIFGDLPLYVAHNSSDVWANQQMFLLDIEGKPSIVGGVPPDYFCEDGQLWGNPLFNWDKLAQTDYQWWLARLYFNFHLFNLVRIDHFRGLESFWAIPADSETAKNGYWMPANGAQMLEILRSRMGNLPIIAEDLGLITPEVNALLEQFNLPGMKVLQFAFSSDSSNEHLPHNFTNNQLVYTGTHDNNTTLGWLNSLQTEQKELVSAYIDVEDDNIAKAFLETAWASVAYMAIAPLQDVMGLGAEARMNVPGTANGNWAWRYDKRQFKNADMLFVKMLNDKYNRK